MSVVIEDTYHFENPIQVVWDSITLNEILIQWMADKITGRPKLGGEFSWGWKFGEEGEFTTHGIYKKIEPLRAITLEWIDHPAGKIVLELEFQETKGGTDLTIRNLGYPDHSDWVEGAREGWKSQVETLRAFLKKNPNPIPLPRKSS